MTGWIGRSALVVIGAQDGSKAAVLAEAFMAGGWPVVAPGSDPHGRAANGRSVVGSLRAVGTTDLYVVGRASDQCFKTVVLAYLAAGFRVCLVPDACTITAPSISAKRAAVFDMTAAGAKTLAAREVTVW